MWEGRTNRSGQPVTYIEEAPELLHRWTYLRYRDAGHELHGPLKPHQPLIRTCGNHLCCSPWS